MSLDDEFSEFLGENPKSKTPQKSPEVKKSAVQKPTPKNTTIVKQVPLESEESEIGETSEVVEETIPMKPAVKPIGSDAFTFEESSGLKKEVYVIYGWKGHGKTTFAFSFEGKIACLSFDRKSDKIKKMVYKDDPRIKVYDAIKYEDWSTPEAWLESSEKSFRFADKLLDEIAKWKPDWIVIDGSEIFQQICEMTMRYRNNLMPFQGISNRNLWKERRMYVRQIHNKSLGIANKGVLWLTYVDKEEIIKDGETIAKTDVPRWLDAIMYETDTVIRVISDQESGMTKFYAIVESSKSGLPNGIKVDVTNSGMKKIFELVDKPDVWANVTKQQEASRMEEIKQKQQQTQKQQPKPLPPKPIVKASPPNEETPDEF